MFVNAFPRSTVFLASFTPCSVQFARITYFAMCPLLHALSMERIGAQTHATPGDHKAHLGASTRMNGYRFLSVARPVDQVRHPGVSDEIVKVVTEGVDRDEQAGVR